MRNYQEVDFGTFAGFVCGAVALAIILVAGGCGDDPQPKNRVPTVSAQIEQAQQAAKDAQAAAERAQQTQKDINTAIARLDGAGRNSDGSWKVGQPQVSGVGTVTEVGEIKGKEGETVTFTFWFTFAERAGFVKKFSPTCPNQAIPVNNTVILNFHWKEYDNGPTPAVPGCYLIDGYTVVK
jgi:outer membrane murein-binding lipoprotein Lpp